MRWHDSRILWNIAWAHKQIQAVRVTGSSTVTVHNIYDANKLIQMAPVHIHKQPGTSTQVLKMTTANIRKKNQATRECQTSTKTWHSFQNRNSSAMSPVLMGNVDMSGSATLLECDASMPSMKRFPRQKNLTLQRRQGTNSKQQMTPWTWQSCSYRPKRRNRANNDTYLS